MYNIPAQNSINVKTSPFMQFADWTHFVEVATAYTPTDARSSRDLDTLINPWAGTTTWEQAVHFARIGEPRATEKLQEIVSALDELQTPLVEDTMYLDMTTNYGWDMGTAITGNPQAGINFNGMEPIAGEKSVEIVLAGSAYASVDPNAMFYRGALAYVLYSSFTAMRYDVSMKVAFKQVGSRGGNWEHQMVAPIMAPGETLDVAVIAYALTNPSVFRRLQFAIMETIFTPESRNGIGVTGGGGYGMPNDINPEYRGDIYIPMKSYGTLRTPEDYLQLIEHAKQIISLHKAGE